MARRPRFPIQIKEQGVSVSIYRIAAKSTRSGFAHKVQWVGGEGAAYKTFADLEAARAFATSKASQLAAGVSASQQMTRADWLELAELRQLAAEVGVAPLAAMQEWRRAFELAGPALVEACSSYASRRAHQLVRVRVAQAINDFIEAKNANNKEGSRTYGSKLRPVAQIFGEHYLDQVTARDWAKFLGRFEDPVTRNDIRKRIVTLCRWAQRQGHLPDNAKTEIEKTERAKEVARPIGILSPGEFRDLLRFFRKEHPRYLAALVLAGFCGVRADEIHGKRGHPERRQLWSDIHLDRGFLTVTAAKENTPSSRIVHLYPAATAWLKLCGESHGVVCEHHAIDRIRKIAATHGMRMPENALRHSYITYRVALTGNKHETATEAGNSVKEIDRRYRVPRPKQEGIEWFNIFPDRLEGANFPITEDDSVFPVHDRVFERT